MLSRRFWRGSSFRAWSRTDRQLNRPGHRRTEPIGVDLGRTPGVLITVVHTSRPLRVINRAPRGSRLANWSRTVLCSSRTCCVVASGDEPHRHGASGEGVLRDQLPSLTRSGDRTVDHRCVMCPGSARRSGRSTEAGPSGRIPTRGRLGHRFTGRACMHRPPGADLRRNHVVSTGGGGRSSRPAVRIQFPAHPGPPREAP